MTNLFRSKMLIAFILVAKLVFAQLPTATQEFRGLWVTQFKTTVLGNSSAEDALIAYAVTNDLNYLICTNMFQILTASCGSFTSDMVALQNFIGKAHVAGIDYVSGNVGSLASAEKIQAYNNCASVTNAQKLDMITYECEFYNSLTNGSCPSYDSYISQLTAIKAICAATSSSVYGRNLVCEAYIGGEGSTGLVLTNSTEPQMEEIASVADHILLTYYRSLPSNSGGNFFNWTINRLNWIANPASPSNIVLLLKSRNTDGNNMNAFLASFPGSHYYALRAPFLSWVEGTAYNPSLTKGYREQYTDGTYPWLAGIRVKGFAWFEHLANTSIITLPVVFDFFDVSLNTNRTVDITWGTLSEVENNYFEVERSIDGNDWKLLKRVIAERQNEGKQNYTIQDNNPATNVSYYRLKQVDFNGKTTYSAIRTLIIDSFHNVYSLYPNPASQRITLYTNVPYSGAISITNAFGQKVNLPFVNEGNSRSFDIDELASGWYFVTVDGQVLRFVKQ